MGRYSNLPRRLELFFTILKLYKIWRKVSYLRLSQLVYLSEDEFYTEDDIFIKKIENKNK